MRNSNGGQNLSYFILLFVVLFFGTSSWGYKPSSEKKQQHQINAYDFIKSSALRWPKLSPDGKLIAFAIGDDVYISNGEKQHKVIDLGQALDLMNFQWTSNQSIIVKYYDNDSHYIYFNSFHFNSFEKNNKITSTKEIAKNGYVVDPLIDDPNHIIFGSYYSKNNKDLTKVFKINTTKKISPQLRSKYRLEKWNNKIVGWLTNHQHKLAIGISYEDEKAIIWRKGKKSRKWKKLWQANNKGSFAPVKLSKDGLILWAITNINSDRKVAVAFDIEQKKISSRLYPEQKQDVEDIIFDDGDKPLSIVLTKNGRVTYKPLKSKSPHLNQLPAEFNNQEYYIHGRNTPNKSLLISAFAPGQAGALYYCQGLPLNCNKISDYYPQLKNVKLAINHVHTIVSKSGNESLNVEFFVSIPGKSSPKSQSVPLLVIPHGGPISISDNSYYHSELQWLAYNGYAILRVNYRGSGGFGKKYQKAGWKQWGRGIEDDIENALQYTLKKYPQLDKNRIAIFGGSYGGYSALMSLVRGKVDYRCAISFAGVTDLNLLFEKASVKNDADVLGVLKSFVGDPGKDKEELKRYSPAYQYQKITKPVLLIHGTKDTVVDIEHSYRMDAMLDLTSTKHEFYVMDNVGHGFKWVKNQVKMDDRVLKFLSKCMK